MSTTSTMTSTPASNNSLTNKKKKGKAKAITTDTANNAMEILEAVMGQELWQKSSKDDGKMLSLSVRDALKPKEFVALYFGAQWSYRSTEFTPHLVDFYHQANATNPNTLEIIYVSTDQTPEEFQEHYIKKMPWLTMPMETEDHVKTANALVPLFKAFRTPCCAVMHVPSGKFVTELGRNDVLTAMGAILQKKQKAKKKQAAQGGESDENETTLTLPTATGVEVQDILSKWRGASLYQSIQDAHKAIDYGGGTLSLVLFFMDRPWLVVILIALAVFSPIIKFIIKKPLIILGFIYLFRRLITPPGDNNQPCLAVATLDGGPPSKPIEAKKAD